MTKSKIIDSWGRISLLVDAFGKPEDKKAWEDVKLSFADLILKVDDLKKRK